MNIQNFMNMFITVMNKLLVVQMVVSLTDKYMTSELGHELETQCRHTFSK